MYFNEILNQQNPVGNIGPNSSNQLSSLLSNFSNNSATAYNSAGSNSLQVILVTMNSGVFVNERGTSSTYTGILTKQDVLDASQQDHYTHHDVGRMVGGGFFDMVKSGFSKGKKHLLKKGKEMASKHGKDLLEKGSNALSKYLM
jgi:hypothetical protein